MCRRYDIDAVICAAIYINVRYRRRFHDGLYGRRFFVVQNSSTGYIDELENRLDTSDGLVGHDIVLVQMMLEFAVRDTYSAPIIVSVVQVSLTAVQEDKLFVPRTFVTMTEQLTVQSDLAIF